MNIKAICNTYPPTISTIAFTGLENVIIRWTCGGARLFPTMTKRDNGIQGYSALLYPFHTKTDSVTNDNSKIIALSMNLGFPKGIATKPIATIETKIIRATR